MLIESLPKDAPWCTVARAVFWSRDVDLAVWREGVLAGHASYLLDSVQRMSTWHFIQFLGRQNFVAHWPVMRQELPAETKGLARLDAAWSLAATGTFNMPPQAAIAAFPGRSREVYDAIVRHQGASIYELAKHASVPYRRVHAHVQAMVGKGLVRTRSDTQGARAKRRLYTMA
jgi:hypothetical protein